MLNAVKNRSGSLVAVVALAVALVTAALSTPPRAEAQVGRASETVRSALLNLTASNAAMTSDVAATDTLVIRSLIVATNTAGTLTITDGTGGNVLFRMYMAANTTYMVGPDQFGPNGLRLTKGAEPYANAISSATAVPVTMRTTLE